LKPDFLTGPEFSPASDIINVEEPLQAGSRFGNESESARAKADNYSYMQTHSFLL
jgi:hypothetical protein